MALAGACDRSAASGENDKLDPPRGGGKLIEGDPLDAADPVRKKETGAAAASRIAPPVQGKVNKIELSGPKLCLDGGTGALRAYEGLIAEGRRYFGAFSRSIWEVAMRVPGDQRTADRASGAGREPQHAGSRQIADGIVLAQGPPVHRYKVEREVMEGPVGHQEQATPIWYFGGHSLSKVTQEAVAQA
jgi:hypothetical protein